MTSIKFIAAFCRSGQRLAGVELGSTSILCSSKSDNILKSDNNRISLVSNFESDIGYKKLNKFVYDSL